LITTGCSSFGALKFWGDEDVEEGPTELYAVNQNRSLIREWSVSHGNDSLFGKLVPAVYDSRIYYINSSGYITSIDFESGKVIWSKNTGDVVSSGVDVNFKTISYSTLNGYLVTLEHNTGNEIWRSSTSSESLSPTVNSGRHLIIQTIDGRVSGYNLKSGTIDWFHQTALPTLTLRGTSSPFLEDGFVFTGFANGKVIMIYPDTGAIRLELPVTLNEGKSELERIIDVDGRPTIVNNLFIAASYQGKITAISLRDGRPVWQEDISSVKDLATNGNRVVAVDDKGIIKAFGTATGASIWQQENLKLRKLTSPVSISNLIAVGDFEGYVHLLNAQSGKFEGRARVSRSPITEIVSKGSYMVVVDESGKVQKLSLD
tara:strand:+ start:4435 stop:5553 length:1119 start_codon:yes stop_codon:yes gene_type:complete